MNLIKLIQTVNYILAKYDYRLNYMKLIKLLYIADRECLDRHCFAISGDTYCSMKNGIVLENLFQCIKNNNSQYQKEWDKFFDRDNYDLVAKMKCDNYGKLSRGERRIIDSVDEKYHDKDEWYLVDNVIHNFPEWDKTVEGNNTSRPLEKRTVFEHLGKSDEEIDELISAEHCLSEMDKLFGVNR